MIIELYGCPGCGKTYAIKEITGEEKTIAMSNNMLKNSLISLLKRLSLYTVASIKLKKNIKRCIQDENTCPIYINRSVESYINNIVILSFGYKHINKNMAMAEGLVHRIVSMAVNFGWKKETVYKFLDCIVDVMGNVQPVYLKVPIETCFESIKKRNRHECEMDELNDEMLMNYLKTYLYLFEYVTNEKKYLTITRDNISLVKELMG